MNRKELSERIRNLIEELRLNRERHLVEQTFSGEHGFHSKQQAIEGYLNELEVEYDSL